VPEAAGVAFGIEGSCTEELKPFGPVQLYVAPETVEALRLNVWPDRIGPSLEAVGAAGAALMAAVVVAAADMQPLAVTVTL